jgi:hypothetical protein
VVKLVQDQVRHLDEQEVSRVQDLLFLVPQLDLQGKVLHALLVSHVIMTL